MSTKIQEQVTVFIITNGYLVADRGEQVVYCTDETAVARRVEAALLEDKGREARNTGRLTKDELDALDHLAQAHGAA